MAKTEKRRKTALLPAQVDRAVRAAEDKKALDLVVLDLRKAAGFTDHFVICSGGNPRQVRAIADAVLGSEVPVVFLIDAATADVSSTAIRSRLATGAPIDGMVPARVQQHIEQHGLYRATTPGRRVADVDAQSPAGRLHGQD